MRSTFYVADSLPQRPMLSIKEPPIGTTACGNGHHLLHKQTKVYQFICNLYNDLMAAVQPLSYISALKDGALRKVW